MPTSHTLNLLQQSIQNNASDIFVIAGKELCIKKDGEIMPVSQQKTTPDDSASIVNSLYELAKRSRTIFDSSGDDDFSVSIPNMARFRVNTYKQRGSVAAVIRVIQFGIPDYHTMNIPENVMNVSKIPNGMVLVTGAAGTGKSTTLACIVDAINKTENVHIVTIEDPIEFLHRNERGIVSQRELSMDTNSYQAALRASLRQAPDVILLGEMRDPDTIQTAMTAAETGHLVLSTLHTTGAVNTIDRIIDVFPPSQQQQIRVQLAQVLRTVISQDLVPTVDKTIVPAFEIMHVTPAIRTMIRESRIHQVDNAIQTGGKDGMISMDDYLLSLFKSGKISRETVQRRCVNWDVLSKKL